MGMLEQQKLSLETDLDKEEIASLLKQQQQPSVAAERLLRVPPLLLQKLHPDDILNLLSIFKI